MLVNIQDKNTRAAVLDELEDRGFVYRKCYYNPAFDADRKICLSSSKPLDIDLAHKTIDISRSLHTSYYEIYGVNRLYDRLNGKRPEKKVYQKGFVTVTGKNVREAYIIKRYQDYTTVRFTDSNGAVNVSNRRIFNTEKEARDSFEGWYRV